VLAVHDLAVFARPTIAVSAVPDLLAFAPVRLAVRATPPPGGCACGMFVRARSRYEQGSDRTKSHEEVNHLQANQALAFQK
jgi:hypothetical protein